MDPVCGISRTIATFGDTCCIASWYGVHRSLVFHLSRNRLLSNIWLSSLLLANMLNEDLASLLPGNGRAGRRSLVLWAEWLKDVGCTLSVNVDAIDYIVDDNFNICGKLATQTDMATYMNKTRRVYVSLAPNCGIKWEGISASAHFLLPSYPSKKTKKNSAFLILLLKQYLK